MHTNLFRFVVRPTAITALPPTLAKALKDELVARVLELGEAGKTVPSELADRLAAYPALFAVALKNRFVSDLDVERLFSSRPYFAVSVIIEQYEALAPRYEASYTEPSPSALGFLIAHTRRIPAATLRPVAEYRRLLLALDPVRHAWLMPIEGEDAAKAEIRSLPVPVEATPATALAEIWAGALSEVPERLVDLLAADNEYLFLAAMEVKRRSPAVADKLIGKIRDPMWAFHALLNGVATADCVRERLHSVLRFDVAWSVELWTRPIWSLEGELHAGTSSLAGGALRTAFGELTRSGLPHPLRRELHTWYRAAVRPELTAMVELT